MALLGASKTTDYMVEMTRNPLLAKISAHGAQVAELQRLANDSTFTLIDSEGGRWTLSRRIYGVLRPFSIIVRKLESAKGMDSDPPVLTIEHGLFIYEGRFYVFNGRPEGKPLREFLLGKKYICRLDNFSFSNLAEVDREAWSGLRRLRGVPVGELEGLGMGGHHVRLLPELEPISLPLTAASYLLYSTA